MKSCKHAESRWSVVSLKILRSLETNDTDRYRGLYRLLLTTATKTCNLSSKRNHHWQATTPITTSHGPFVRIFHSESVNFFTTHFLCNLMKLVNKMTTQSRNIWKMKLGSQAKYFMQFYIFQFTIDLNTNFIFEFNFH